MIEVEFEIITEDDCHEWGHGYVDGSYIAESGVDAGAGRPPRETARCAIVR